jgi:hypothetical protein
MKFCRLLIVNCEHLRAVQFDALVGFCHIGPALQVCHYCGRPLVVMVLHRAGGLVLEGAPHSCHIQCQQRVPVAANG